MHVEETTSDGLKRELRVVIDASELNARLSRRLEELKEQVPLKGFRRGKVPVTHLRKVYGRTLMAEVVQEAVAESSRKAITDRQERPALQPEISLPEDEDEIEKVIAGNADLAYVMSFEVLPEFEIGDLSELTLEKQVAEVSEADIDRGLEQLAESNITYADKGDAPAADGDQVTMDFEGSIDGERFESGAAEDAQVILGRGRFLPGFEEGLVGARAGEARTVTTDFPDDYPAETLAGKQASFEVRIKKVEQPVRPEVTDDFAKSLGLDTVEDLRAAIKSKLADEFAAASRAKLKRALFDRLDETYRFELPQTLVDNEFETIWDQLIRDMQSVGQGFADGGTTEDDTRREYRAIAERRVRLGLVIARIGEAQEIRVSDEELNRALMDRLRQFPGRERQVYDYYQKHPHALNELRTPIFEDKVVDYVLELAQVTETKVTAEELFKMPDAATQERAS